MAGCCRKRPFTNCASRSRPLDTKEKGTEVLFDSTYAVDPSRNPKEIDMIGTEGDFARKTAQGIYSLEDNTLQICYTMPGKPRPNAFSSPAGSGIYLIVWKRQSP